MSSTLRADVALVQAGLARSRAHAAELIRSGRVSEAARPVTKPAQLVSVPGLTSSDTMLQVTPDPTDHDYASRGALKLLGALSDFGGEMIEITGQHCLDLGASTGGFTDVLLRRGAVSVTAIDVGHGQLIDRLRVDPRVQVIEGFNVRDLTRADLTHPPALIVGDLSFISLRLILPAVAAVMEPRTQALLLVKPQFEVGKERLGAGGLVRDDALRLEAVEQVKAAGRQLGLTVRAETPSCLPGASGNHEYFVLFERDSISEPETNADHLGGTA